MDEFEAPADGRRIRLDAAARMRLTVQAAVALVDGCDHAGVTVVDDEKVSTAASTDDVVERGDRMQFDLQEGPCVDAVHHHDIVISQDLGTDPRWPRWAPLACRELDVTSVVSLLLYAQGRSFGALNLYGRRARSFSSGDLATAHTLAAHLAIFVASGPKGDDKVRGAARAATVIGQAEGLLMAWLDIDEHQAFAYLRRVAARHDRELAEVAAEMVRTRVPPLHRD